MPAAQPKFRSCLFICTEFRFCASVQAEYPHFVHLQQNKRNIGIQRCILKKRQHGLSV